MHSSLANRTGDIILGVQCKLNMQTPCSEMSKVAGQQSSKHVWAPPSAGLL